MQHSMTPLVNLTLSLDEFPHSIAFSCKFLLTDNPQYHGIEWQLIGPLQMDCAPETASLNHATLFPFALMHPFCCTVCGQLLVCCVHSHTVICNCLYLLAVLQTFDTNNPHIHATNSVSQFGIHHCSTALHITTHHPNLSIQMYNICASSHVPPPTLQKFPLKIQWIFCFYVTHVELPYNLSTSN